LRNKWDKPSRKSLNKEERIFRNYDITLRRRLDRKVEQFYVWLINEKGMKPNTAWTYVTGIKSVMSFYDVNIRLKIKRPKSCANDLTEKTLVAMASHISLRINDFNEIIRSNLMINRKKYKQTKLLQLRVTPLKITSKTLLLVYVYNPFNIKLTCVRNLIKLIKPSKLLFLCSLNLYSFVLRIRFLRLTH